MPPKQPVQKTPNELGTLTTNNKPAARGNWSNPLQFILACIGYAVGLGNVWRFPYLVFRNGGGAFLLPYFIMVFLIGLPIFFAELFVGQFSGLGPIKAYHHLAPFFKGLGFCVLVVISFVTIYYMVVISWIIFYFFASFTSHLQWGYCDNDYNSYRCHSSLEDLKCKDTHNGTENDAIYWNYTCTMIKDICKPPELIAINATYCKNASTSLEVPVRHLIKRVLAAEEFYYIKVLGVSGATWSNWGYPRWQLVLCLLFAWLIAFCCLIKGVQSAGKVIYFTALFPYVILTALLIRGVTLDGAKEGIIFYIKPDWSTLLKPSVWGDAASQIFYSFGLACGSLVAFASYNHYGNNCHRDAIFVSLTNVFTCIFAGFSVFVMLGFLAKNINVPVNEVVQSGPGLAFIAYPEAVMMMPWPSFWAIAFFFMMFTLGMGSQFGGIEAICTSLMDQWPHLRASRWKVTGGVCFACFLAGLPMVCNGGVYLFTLMEWHTASWAILLLGLAEVAVLAWVYGINRVFENLNDMGMNFTGFIRLYWKSVWLVLSPLSCVGVFIFTMTDIGQTQYGDYHFPVLADAFGWFIGTLTLVPFFGFLLHKLWLTKGSFKGLFDPTDEWKPQPHDNKPIGAENDATQ